MKTVYRFLGGSALGAFLVAIFISFGASVDFNLAQIGIASMLIISCGVMSSIWGEKFIDVVMKMLDGTTF